ncbi:hypothetical protein ACSBR2_002671 [Camellia fascicularis]
MESFNSLLQLARSLMQSSTSTCDHPKPVISLIANLTGTIPLSIGNLSNLHRLSLVYNNLEGSIPTQLGQLYKLEVLQPSVNNLSVATCLGGIPNSIGKLSMLEIFLLDRNNISGEIPSSIRNMSRLGILDLSTNMIEGSISSSLGNCTNLQEIHLDSNHLTGAIPYQIFGMSSLINLSLSQNYLTGLLPQEVGNLKNLNGLYVSKNKLFGEIPETLGNCEVLEFLYIDGNFFEGTIPTAFRQLKGIQELDVSRNNLSKQIPRFLGEFQFFQYLNLSYNIFDGEVPNGGVFTTISAFSVVGNTIVYRNKRSRQQVKSASPLQNQYLQLSFGELFQATNGLSPFNLIGEGGYGSVYKGILNSDEQIVAMKMLKLHEHGANKSFVTECEALKNIRHRNLVKIITACSSIDFKGNDFKALVFEFMENGSLDNWLHPSLLEQNEPKNLNFVQRLNIAINVACALDYLHNHCEMAFVHCDLKSSNVNLHSYVKMCPPEQVMQIVDLQIILEMEEEPSRSMQSSTTNISKLETCLVPVLQIRVSCSAEMPTSVCMPETPLMPKLTKRINKEEKFCEFAISDCNTWNYIWFSHGRVLVGLYM